jgi:molybdenum cofactor cytidylyltransferase
MIDLAVDLSPDEVCIVSGAWHRELMDARKKGQLSDVSFVYADRWSDGLAASLVAGIEYLEPNYDAVLVLLADQVALTRSDLERLLSAFEGDNIACSFYDGKRGVPATFGHNSFNRLKRLSGDQGAKMVLYESDIPVRECPIPHAAIDIDSRTQLAEWTNSIE